MGVMKDLLGGAGRGASAGGGGNAGIQVEATVDPVLFKKYNEALARLFISHPDTKKRVKKALQEEAKRVRKDVTRDVKDNLDNDPRKSYLAVKRSLYKRMLGFNVSILNPKSVRSMRIWRPERKVDQNPHQRGGNRRKRSSETKRIDGYYGAARAFILRFYNSGTSDRLTRFGNRGSIRQRRLFEISATYQMESAVVNVSNLIEEVLAEEYNHEIR